MPSEVFNLFLLLQLKDMASGGLNRVEARMRSAGKEGRQLLQTFQDMREEQARGLTLAGVGVGTLALMKKGVDVAGDYESAMADMRMSYQEVGKDGQLNIAKLRSEMGRLEAQTVSLGNRLPGTTQDFVEMYTTLKRGGLDAETILGGTGEAVANLAIITKQIPKDLAEPFAQYVQQYRLTGDEAKKLADVLGRIEFATGLKPQELIEGSKFFQMRAGDLYKMKGLEGADVGGRMLAALRSYGLEGGIGGRELGGFMLDLGFKKKEQQKALAELKKTKGIELKIFDKGEFLGFENLFRQMEKLRGLTTEEKLNFGEKLFNRETIAIMNLMSTMGVEGWKKVNDRIDKIPPQQELINQKTATYNAKVESLTGTLTNLTATAFTPMLDVLKPMVDTGNEMVGWLQGVAKQHPEVAKYATTIVGIGGVTLTLYGTLRAGQTAWGLWRLASAAALKGTAADAMVTKGALSGLGTPIKISIIATEVLVVLAELRELKRIIDETNAKSKEVGAADVSNYNRLLDMKKQGTATPELYSLYAQTALMELNREGSLSRAFRGSTANVTEPIRSYFNIPEKGTGFEKTASALWGFATFGPAGRYAGIAPQYHPFYDASESQRVQLFRQRAPALQQPEVMAEFVKAVQGLKDWDKPAREGVLNLAKQSFPESFDKSFTLFSTNTLQLSEDAKKTAEQLQKLGVQVEPMPNQFNNAGVAAQRFADRVNTISFAPSFGSPNIVGTTIAPVGTVGPVIPSKASGGRVIQSGLVNVHRGEDIVPARVTERYEDRFSDIRHLQTLREQISSVSQLRENFSELRSLQTLRENDRFTQTNQVLALRERIERQDRARYPESVVTLREAAAQSPRVEFRPQVARAIGPQSSRLTERYEPPRVEFRPEVARAIMNESRAGSPATPQQEVHHHDNRKIEVHVHASTNDPAELARLVAHAVQIEIERS